MGTGITTRWQYKAAAALIISWATLSAAAAPFSIGNETIEVPTPRGLVNAGGSPAVSEMGKRLTPSTMTSLGDFFTGKDLAAAETGGLANFKPQMWARVMTPGKPGQVVVLTAERWKTLPDELAKVEAAAVTDRATKELEKTFGKVGLDASNPQVTVVDDRMATMAFGGKVTVGESEFPIVAVMNLIRIKQRLVMASVYRIVKGPDDITAARSYAKDWGAAIEKANPAQ
ncbi:hypothetical protein [Burkholderia cepacia]|uniref:hypothetical protein n=1 Tax=Burkholderia cepacia TaxID=292 RepID=UPI001CF185F3|nr:hypothetical protein [Burkholderia cepacia]MCA8323257.1 hypothetical protein [Burkholderia cepacia]